MTSAPGRAVFIAANPSVDRLLEVDAIELGAINRPERVVPVAGGKGLNAARAASALGGSAVAIALVGGHSGAWIEDRLVDLGLTASLVQTGAETRTCVSVLDRATGRLTEFYEPGLAVPSEAFVALEAAVAAELEQGDARVLAMSGSLPLGAPLDGYARLIRLAREHGVVTVVDAQGEPLATGLDARPDVVKVNAAEAGEISGSRVTDATSATASADALRRAGAGCAVITLGGDGAVIATDHGRWHLTSQAPAGAYFVGSGDAFLGGLAVGLARGQSVLDAARLGMAAGIANTHLPGAGVLDGGLVAGLVPAIEVRSI
jgi:1-phosphofructokinase family hexose kinase